jgi:glycosyltransferase involved in cell wall biosynthesis
MTRYLGVPPQEQIILPVAIPPRFRPLPKPKAEEFKAQYQLPDTYWLYVANTAPHKNHIKLLRAYRMLLDEGISPWPLVLRGDPGAAERQLQEAVESYDLHEHIIRLPRMSNEEMPALYSAATALVFPSTFEGGGIPVPEAMACRCPAVASDIPVIREFAGDAPLFIDPESVLSLAGGMKRFQKSAKLRRMCARRGLSQAQKFSGENVVNRHLSAISTLKETWK